MNGAAHVEASSAMGPLLSRLKNRMVENTLGVGNILHVCELRQAEVDRTIPIACGISYRLCVKKQPSFHHSHWDNGNSRRNSCCSARETNSLIDLALPVLKGGGLRISMHEDHITWGQIHGNLNLLMQSSRGSSKPSEIGPMGLHGATRKMLVQQPRKYRHQDSVAGPVGEKRVSEFNHVDPKIQAEILGTKTATDQRHVYVLAHVFFRWGLGSAQVH